MSDADIPLLGAAYNALVENCVYQQDTDSWREGMRVIAALSRRLEINPELDVRDALEGIEQ